MGIIKDLDVKAYKVKSVSDKPIQLLYAKRFTPFQKLMALSWKQPYADLMLQGKIETRTWNTNYRGWVLMSASLKSYNTYSIDEISGSDIVKSTSILKQKNWRTGVAIAIGRLVDSRPMTFLDEAKCFVKYHPNLFCHVYEDVQAIVPIPWKGTQGWKEVPEEFKNRIEII